jgi:hypothetical protein
VSTVFFVLAIACALATLATLFAGILSMGRGGDAKTSGERSNRLMRVRVLLQGAALIFIVLWWFTKS